MNINIFRALLAICSFLFVQPILALPFENVTRGGLVQVVSSVAKSITLDGKVYRGRELVVKPGESLFTTKTQGTSLWLPKDAAVAVALTRERKAFLLRADDAPAGTWLFIAYTPENALFPKVAVQSYGQEIPLVGEPTLDRIRGAIVNSAMLISDWNTRTACNALKKLDPYRLRPMEGEESSEIEMPLTGPASQMQSEALHRRYAKYQYINTGLTKLAGKTSIYPGRRAPDRVSLYRRLKIIDLLRCWQRRPSVIFADALVEAIGAQTWFSLPDSDPRSDRLEVIEGEEQSEQTPLYRSKIVGKLEAFPADPLTHFVLRKRWAIRYDWHPKIVYNWRHYPPDVVESVSWACSSNFTRPWELADKWNEVRGRPAVKDSQYQIYKLNTMERLDFLIFILENYPERRGPKEPYEI